MKTRLLSIARRWYLLGLFFLFLPVARDRTEPNLRGVIWSDSEGYYIYNPAVFVTGLHCVPEGSMNLRKNARGEVVMKYTCGVAIFQMPFFLAAKAWSDARGLPREEIYSRHYARSVVFAGFFACFLGLFFMQKALRRAGFGEPTVFLTVLATFAGTNLFHYATKEPGMSHAYSFLLFAFVAWLTPRVFERPSRGHFALLGAALGWIVLVRPTGILAVLWPLFYHVYSLADLRERFGFLKKHLPKIGLAALAGFAFLFLQMLYWHEMTGQWVRYSYDGERFEFWSQPKILAVLFDSQNGLFAYSPVVLLSVLGIWFGLRERKNHAPGLALMFVLATYAFASWWAWWFGGAFGHRCYVEYYAFLAFPLAAVVQKALNLRPLAKTLALAAIGFLIFYGWRVAFLYMELGNPWDGPEWRWNWSKMVWIWEHLFSWPKY